MFPGLSSILGPTVSGIVDLVKEYIPNPAEQAKFQREVEARMNEALVASAQMQGQITLEESKSESLFKSGWRPLLGWGSSIALLWSVVGAPTLSWSLTILGHAPVGVPDIPADLVFNLVLTLLGVAGMRSFEKAKGVAGNAPSKSIPGPTQDIRKSLF